MQRIAGLLRVGIDHVEAAAFRRVPEALEGGADPAGLLQPALRRPPQAAAEIGHGHQGVEPEGIDLHRFAAPGGDHPTIGDRIHPGELHAGGTAAQQTIGWIHGDVEAGADQVVLQHLLEPPVQLAGQIEIVAGLHVLPERLEIPEPGIHRVEVHLLQRSPHFREAVGQHAPIEGFAEAHEQGAGDLLPAGAEGQAGEADQRVASPVLEPVVAGDDRPRRPARPGLTGDQELVGRQHQLVDPGRGRGYGSPRSGGPALQ